MYSMYTVHSVQYLFLRAKLCAVGSARSPTLRCVSQFKFGEYYFLFHAGLVGVELQTDTFIF